MHYRRLGKTGIRVSELCLGTMTFGEADSASFLYGVGCDEKTSFDIMNRAAEAGINFFDSADVYGQEGLSERIVGDWLSSTGKRNQIVLATKFRLKMEEHINGVGASRYRMMRAVEASLRRLKTDRIDLFQIHVQDNHTPEEETLRAFDDLVSQGKVLYVGASNYAAFRLAESQWISRANSFVSYSTLQMQYNLITRGIEREHVPFCEKYGLGIMAWSPLAGGFLTGKYRQDELLPQTSRMQMRPERYRTCNREKNWQILNCVFELARELEITPAQLSLAWLLQRPSVSSVIIGARSASQLKDNLGVSAIQLPQEIVAKLNDVSAVELGDPYDFINRVNAAEA